MRINIRSRPGKRPEPPGSVSGVGDVFKGLGNPQVSLCDADMYNDNHGEEVLYIPSSIYCHKWDYRWRNIDGGSKYHG